MVRKTKHMRVHPDFFELFNHSDMTSRDFTKVISEKIWEEKVVDSKKRKKGLAGFRL